MSAFLGEQPARQRNITKRPRQVRAGTLERRRELLGIVYECIAEHGIDGVSMRQVATAANVSTGSINYHFKNKNALMIAALEAAYELPDDWQNYQGSPITQLRKLTSRYVFRSNKERFWLFWVNYVASSSRNDIMRQHLQDRYVRQHNFWASLLRDSVGAGEVRADIDPMAEAERLLLICHGLVIRQIQSPDLATRASAKELIEEAVSKLLPGSAIDAE